MPTFCTFLSLGSLAEPMVHCHEHHTRTPHGATSEVTRGGWQGPLSHVVLVTCACSAGWVCWECYDKFYMSQHLSSRLHIPVTGDGPTQCSTTNLLVGAMAEHTGYFSKGVGSSTTDPSPRAMD